MRTKENRCDLFHSHFYTDRVHCSKRNLTGYDLIFWEIPGHFPYNLGNAAAKQGCKVPYVKEGRNIMA